MIIDFLSLQIHTQIKLKAADSKSPLKTFSRKILDKAIAWILHFSFVKLLHTTKHVTIKKWLDTYLYRKCKQTIQTIIATLQNLTKNSVRANNQY